MCVSVESACISSLSLSIDVIFHLPYYVHSQWVSCCLVPCFECVFLLIESACISSLSLSIDVIFHLPYYVHSQEVSCCLVPCFECEFPLKVHVFLLSLYPLT